jgi:hypothetical protein
MMTAPSAELSFIRDLRIALPDTPGTAMRRKVGQSRLWLNYKAVRAVFVTDIGEKPE